LSGVDIRPIREDAELALALGIHNVLHPHDALALADVKSFIAQTHDHEGYLAWSDGAAIGMARASLLHDRVQPVVDVLVAHEHRRRGIGSALYDCASRWVRARGHETAEVWIEDRDAAGIDFATKRGFSEIGREVRVVLDLSTSAPPVASPPDGVEIVSWAERPDVVHGMHEVAVEAFPDIPGEEDSPVPSFEQWLADHMQGAGDRAEATFVALHGDEVVGYSKFSLTTAQPTAAHHDLTGVKRAWRGRGIARALKSAQIEWARRNGYERLVTRNEERNTPIRRLNEEFGYKPESARIVMRGPVSAAT
jgi:mycothiol synthase